MSGLLPEARALLARRESTVATLRQAEAQARREQEGCRARIRQIEARLRAGDTADTQEAVDIAGEIADQVEEVERFEVLAKCYARAAELSGDAVLLAERDVQKWEQERASLRLKLRESAAAIARARQEQGNSGVRRVDGRGRGQSALVADRLGEAIARKEEQRDQWRGRLAELEGATFDAAPDQEGEDEEDNDGGTIAAFAGLMR